MSLVIIVQIFAIFDDLSINGFTLVLQHLLLQCTSLWKKKSNFRSKKRQALFMPYHTESMLESAFRHATVAAGSFSWSMTRISTWTSPLLWPSVLEHVSVLNVVNKLGLLLVIFRRGLFPQDDFRSTMLWYVISNDVVAIRKYGMK